MKTILFGAGQNGREFVQDFSDLNYKLFLYCDNNIDKWGGNLDGIPIISFPKMLKMYKNSEVYRIIITVGNAAEIINQCILNQISPRILFYYNRAEKRIITVSEIYSDTITSQDGEEVYLKQIFAKKEKGIYVDVGANHPIRFSNTWWAYIKGWRGLNIEPDINNFKLLESIRSEDINVNCGIANQSGQLDYYEFQESALNTFSLEEIDEKIKNKIIDIHRVPVRRLSDILVENNIHEIDFIDIDVEGMELEVLDSINWDDVSIQIVMVEQRGMSLQDVLNSEVCQLLFGKGYKPINKYNRTVIYEKSNEVEEV